MTYALVAYNVTKVSVAALTGTNTYGTPATINILTRLEVSDVIETDMLPSYGMMAEALAIPTHKEGKLTVGSAEIAASPILFGRTWAADTGTPPNQSSTQQQVAGGAGFPYFAIIAQIATTGGGSQIIGAPKCQIQGTPMIGGDANRFSTGEMSFIALPANPTIGRVMRIDRAQGTYVFPADAAAFATFFTGFFS
jgi:hypothetical protein